MALKTAERIGDAVIQTRCLTYLAVTYRRSGDVDETRRYAALSLRLASELTMVEYIAMARASFAWAAWREGNLGEVATEAREALKLWHKMPDPYGFDWMALLPLMAVSLSQGNVAEAIECARGLFGENQHPVPEGLTAAAKRAIEAWDQKKSETAKEKIEEAIRISKEIGYL